MELLPELVHLARCPIVACRILPFLPLQCSAPKTRWAEASQKNLATGALPVEQMLFPPMCSLPSESLLFKEEAGTRWATQSKIQMEFFILLVPREREERSVFKKNSEEVGSRSWWVLNWEAGLINKKKCPFGGDIIRN